MKEAEAREPLDATEGKEVEIDALDFGTKCADPLMIVKYSVHLFISIISV